MFQRLRIGSGADGAARSGAWRDSEAFAVDGDGAAGWASTSCPESQSLATSKDWKNV